MNPLYFVTVSNALHGGVIWGGHFYAPTPAAAKQIVRAKYNQDQDTARRENLRPLPALGACEIKARRSVSYANAMNSAEG